MAEEKNKSLVDLIYDLYTNPEGIDTEELAEQSLIQFKESFSEK